jgi:glycerol uptake facilitator-like aquaporin
VYQKLGLLLDVSADVLFGAQILGSFLGGLFAVFWYRVFTSRASLQNDADEVLGLPAAHMWYATAKQALKRGIPRSALIAAAITGACFLLLAIIKFFSVRQGWRFTKIHCPMIQSESSGSWIPNVQFMEREWLALFPAGSSFAIGECSADDFRADKRMLIIVLAMNNIPCVTIAWSLGGLVRLILSSIGFDKNGILLIGSGLMLGEGLAETVVLLLGHWLSLIDKPVVCLMKC